MKPLALNDNELMQWRMEASSCAQSNPCMHTNTKCVRFNQTWKTKCEKSVKRHNAIIYSSAIGMHIIQLCVCVCVQTVWMTWPFSTNRGIVTKHKKLFYDNREVFIPSHLPIASATYVYMHWKMQPTAEVVVAKLPPISFGNITATQRLSRHRQSTPHTNVLYCTGNMDSHKVCKRTRA